MVATKYIDVKLWSHCNMIKHVNISISIRMKLLPPPTTCQDDEGRGGAGSFDHHCSSSGSNHPTNNLGAKPWVSWQVGGRGKISSWRRLNPNLMCWPALVFQVLVWQQKSDYIWYGPCQPPGARHAAVKPHIESSFLNWSICGCSKDHLVLLTPFGADPKILNGLFCILGP